MGKMFEGQSAKRVPLSCLNRSGETFSVKCSSLAMACRSLGRSNFSQNSFLLHKNMIRKPTILLEKLTGGFNRINLSNGVSMRAGMSSYHVKNRSRFLRMKQTSLNLAARNCVVLLKDLGKKYIKNGNPTSGLAGQKRRMKQMKIDQCFVSLTDCSRKISVRNTRTGSVARKRLKRSNSRWMCVKENHSVLTKSLANSKSVRSNNNGVVLRQNRSNSI